MGNREICPSNRSTDGTGSTSTAQAVVDAQADVMITIDAPISRSACHRVQAVPTTRTRAYVSSRTFGHGDPVGQKDGTVY